MKVSTVRGLLAALTALYLAVLPAFAADGNATNAAPVWRLQALVIPSGIRNPSLGLYHRLGSRWEIGSQLASRLSDDTEVLDLQRSQSDSLRLSRSRQSQRNNSVAATFELRHWGSIEPRVAWFIGCQVQGAYTNVRDKTREVGIHDTDFTERITERHGPSGALAAVLGADFTLLDHLSVMFALRPIQYTHEWLDIKIMSTQADGGNSYRYGNTGTDHTAMLTTDLSPELFLTIHLGK